MPDPKAISNHKMLIKLEDKTAQQIVRAYERALQEIVTNISERMLALGAQPDVADVRLLARDVGLISEIEDRLRELSTEYRVILRAGLSDSQQIGLAQVQREIARLTNMLNIGDLDIFTGIDPQLPGLIEAIVGQIDRLGDQQRVQLTNELMVSLIRGDDLPTIIDRLFALEPGADGISLARQGKNSVELLARRAIIEANNASRQLIYSQARQQIPDLKKQLVAVVQPKRTTKTCLKAHGQIREIDEPYVLTGKPRFARKIMYPPFHWRCRSSSVAYHPQFEQSSALTTEEMREAAREELAQR